jgi:hypothetical protein
VVLDGGRVVEQGTHAGLFTLQASRYADPAAADAP